MFTANLLRPHTLSRVPTLLLSARNLVSLHLRHIPPTGYISPGAIVAGLPVLTRLESLCILFSCPRIYQSRMRLDPPMRAVLPALTYFRFAGRTEYLDDLVAVIDALRLHSIHTDVDKFDFLQVPQIFLFVGRTDNLSFRRVQVDFTSEEVTIELQVDPYRLNDAHQPYFGLSTSFDWSDHVAHIAPILTQILAMCPNVDYRLFPTVKMLHMSGRLAVQVARALDDVPGEMVTEVFPSLLSLILESMDHKELISAEQFVSLRRLHGRPVTLYKMVSQE